MNNYDMYQEQPRESLSKSLFGSPLKAQWTLQKLSMTSHFFGGKVWDDLAAGRGFKSPGIVGLRGLISGQNAAGSRVARALSPSNAIFGVFPKFKEKGFLGSFNEYNAINKTDEVSKAKNTVFKKLEQILGGGVVEGTAFEQKYHGEMPKNVKHAIKFKNRKTFADIKNPDLKSKIIELADEGDKYKLAKKARAVAKAGKFASRVLGLKIAWDVSSAIGGFAVNTVSSMASIAEQKLSNLTNNSLEFGGKLGIGFYSGASATERQRALSSIRGTAAMGNEASYQHVASTW